MSKDKPSICIPCMQKLHLGCVKFTCGCPCHNPQEPECKHKVVAWKNKSGFYCNDCLRFIFTNKHPIHDKNTEWEGIRKLLYITPATLKDENEIWEKVQVLIRQEISKAVESRNEEINNWINIKISRGYRSIMLDDLLKFLNKK
jgi:hypothetical protein